MIKTPMELFAVKFPNHVLINKDKKWWQFWKETYVFTPEFLQSCNKCKQ